MTGQGRERNSSRRDRASCEFHNGSRYALLLSILVLFLVPAGDAGAQRSDTLRSRVDSPDSLRSPENKASPDTVRLLALTELLERASKGNSPPADLRSFKARVESEVAVLIRQAGGNELTVFLEQIASDLYWDRSGVYEQHVVGHQSQQMGVTFASLSSSPIGWVQPTLYGSRFRLRNPSVERSGRGEGGSRGVAGDGADTMPIVHPLAPDRSEWYSFSGGDTVVTITLPDRSIPIVLVRVRPRSDLQQKAVLFDGEVGLDASRGTLVRIRGRFVRAGGKMYWPGSLGTAVAFIEFEQLERGGRYWLPFRQRIELQAAAPFFGEARAVVRIASRIQDLDVNAVPTGGVLISRADSIRLRGRRRLTLASRDSLSRFNDWVWQPGVITSDMHADDFNDIGPDIWRLTGPPRFDLAAYRMSDVLRFNRVEGFYTGVGARLALRDIAPGVEFGGTAGYAWSEETMRGRLSMLRQRGKWRYELRGGRSLDVTNDFRSAGDSGANFITALGGLDPNDYVDRTSVMLLATREFGKREFLIRAEAGYADDRYRPALLERGPMGKRLFRENRYLDAGGYLLARGVLEWHPDVSVALVKPGVGGRVDAQIGSGTLSWMRVEARATVRRLYGPFIAVSQLDAGIVTGAAIPPQQLFELGKQQALPGYNYKEFAGSRAAAGRLYLAWFSPFLRNPLTVPWFPSRLILPGIRPGFGAGIQAGWAEAPNEASRSAIARLRPPGESMPLPRPTGGVRGTVSFGLNLFSGSILLGFARPVDRPERWRGVIGAQFQ